MIRGDIDWELVYSQFKLSTPFNHVVIDNFFLFEIADQLSNEFPDFNDPFLGHYDSPIEKKKCCNQWDKFSEMTYRAFTYLSREKFLSHMRELVETNDLWMDIGLNGGGWHMHGPSGNLNVHLDYNIHPKLNEQRKLNIIIYLTKDWNNEWGGGLELWSNDDKTRQPKELVKTLDNVYNRAVIFDTTQNSWHGLPKHLTCPEGTYRKSLAAYYVRPAEANSDPRGKALFAPREDQKNDESIKELIRKRANVSSAENVWKS
jgi:hypothetical protein